MDLSGAQNNLRYTAKVYLNTSLHFYIENEGEVSIYNEEKFSNSVIIVCSLSRSIEHLLKLRLLKIDPLLLYPFPKIIEDYCRIKQIPIHGDVKKQRILEEKQALSHTISFTNALERVEKTYQNNDYNFKPLRKIYSLRNSLEHHWDWNEGFLSEVIGDISKKIIPMIKLYIEKILEEDTSNYFDKYLISDVEILDRAKEQEHSLLAQKRLEDHIKLFQKDILKAKEKLTIPAKYKDLSMKDTGVKCPVCNELMTAYWDWEADYDNDGDDWYISNAYPFVKLLFCDNCHFYIEGYDIEKYLPNGLEIEFEPDY